MARSAALAPVIGVVAFAAALAIILVSVGRFHLTHKSYLEEKKVSWSSEIGTDSVFLPKNVPKSIHEGSGMTFHALKARFQELAAVPVEVQDPNVKTMEMQYNLCESCYTTQCPYFTDNACEREYVKPQCLPEVLVAACPDCADSGCSAVLEFIQNDPSINETAGGDNITKITVLRDLTWTDARKQALAGFADFSSCVGAASTVALAEKCLGDFLHPFPSDILRAALDDSSEVGPPVCSKNYLGDSCSPLPSPADNKDTCPKGFMCMPDPNQCEQCACSCNSPTDKLDQLQACLTHAPHPAQGLYCFQSFFTQLPPAFVERIVAASELPQTPEEQYFLILNACGGAENGTDIVNTCLEHVEYCIRPRQGLPGEFPTDAHQFQSLCECFRDPAVLANCGPEPANQTSCAGAIRDHYVMHVHHKYCVSNTEAACNFQCKWPLPGFFGDLIPKK